MVTRNPCLHPGDVRQLEAVDVPELRHLVDCIVFPKNGARPHPNEMAGKEVISFGRLLGSHCYSIRSHILSELLSDVTLMFPRVCPHRTRDLWFASPMLLLLVF